MENLPFKPEVGEKEKYVPRYLIFLGRHAEPAKGSVFDAIGGENGIRSDNFEESSLTLKGLMDSSLLNYDLLEEITKRIPTGKIRIVLSNTKAYRTHETALLIKEKIENEDKASGRDIKVEVGDAYAEPLLTEKRDEEGEQSDADIRSLVEAVEAHVTPEEALVYVGITHDAKLSNFLHQNGIENNGVNTSEFLTITDEGNGKNLINFRDEEAEIITGMESGELAQ